MSFEEELNVKIDSVFDSKGFRQFQKRLDEVRSNVAPFSQIFEAAEKTAGRQKFLDEFNRKLENSGLKIRELNEDLRDFGAMRDMLQNRGGIDPSGFDNINSAALSAREQMDKFNGVVVDSNNNLQSTGDMVERLTGQFELPSLGQRNQSRKSDRADLSDTSLRKRFEAGEGPLGGFETERAPNLQFPSETKAVTDAGFSKNVPLLNEMERSLTAIANTSMPDLLSQVVFPEELVGKSKMLNKGLSENSEVITTFDRAMNQARQSTADMSQSTLLGSRRLQLMVNSLRMLRRNTLLGSKKLQEMANSFRESDKTAQGFQRVLSRQIPTLQNLQMALLGVQFQLLSLAFIFGGLLAPALGAVGIFSILSTTLKQLFLPTALSLLPIVFDIRDALLDLDDGLVKTIGQFLVGATVVTALGSALAFLVNGLLSVASVLGTPIAVAVRLIRILGFLKFGTSSLIGILSAFGSGGVIGGITAVGSVIASLAAPILAIIGIAIALFVVFQRFPGIADMIMDTLGVVFKMFKLTFISIIDILKGAFNIITGIITTVVAVLTGDFDKAIKGIKEILFGLRVAILRPFVRALNFVTQNVLPGFIDFAETVLTGFIDVIQNNATVIKDALLGLVPKGVRGIVDDNLNFEQMAEDAKELVTGVTDSIGTIEKLEVPKLGKDFKPKDSGKSQEPKKKEENNMFSFGDINMDENNKTPIETGRELGRGVNQETKNRRSSIFESGT